MSVVVYHFWSPTCQPCKVIKPSVEVLKEDFDSVQWVSVNTHDDRDSYSQKYGVSVVPTMVVTKNGVEIGRHSGTQMITYYTIIRKALST